MANGDVWESIEGLRGDIKEVMMRGCAKREGDLERTRAVEDSLRELRVDMKKIYYTSLVTAGGIIAFLLKAFIPMFLGK